MTYVFRELLERNSVLASSLKALHTIAIEKTRDVDVTPEVEPPEAPLDTTASEAKPESLAEAILGKLLGGLLSVVAIVIMCVVGFIFFMPARKTSPWTPVNYEERGPGIGFHLMDFHLELPNWMTPIAIGVLGAAVALLGVYLMRAFGNRSLSSVPPVPTQDPMPGLTEFTTATAARLRTMSKTQYSMAWILFALFVGLVVWTIVLISMCKMTQAAGFGSASVAGSVLTKWVWQPFDRAVKCTMDANFLGVLALGLENRMIAINQMTSPSDKEKAVWIAIRDYFAEIKLVGKVPSKSKKTSR